MEELEGSVIDPFKKFHNFSDFPRQIDGKLREAFRDFTWEICKLGSF